MTNDNEKNKSGNNQAEEETKIYLTSDSTLQTPEEHQHDQSVDPRKDTTIEVSNDDLRETVIDRQRNEVDGERGTSGSGDS
ncbi:MAG: hypothetical protein JWR72_4158 [Flavisolibacter sp.]|jgi:hypothetical protein|nr:hypothetical protein [Flavisolibacter sp.]